MKNLYQPIVFKRTKTSNWESGWKETNKNGERFLEKDMKTMVEQIYKYEVNWGI